MLVKDLNIKEGVTLVAVTKNKTIQEVQTIYDQNVRDFGENRIEELLEKYDVFADVTWHFIGRIQSKKIAKIVKTCSLIHSISNIEHLLKCNSSAKNINKIQDILLQINISEEVTKDGFNLSDINEAIKLAKTLENINLKGIMVIGDHVENSDVIRHTFDKGYEVKEKYNFEILSMGMSNDYELAIDCGSNMVRIGSILY